MHTNTGMARKENGAMVDAHRHRFATPLRRAFKRLKVTRKRNPSGESSSISGHPFGDRSNYMSLTSEVDGDEQIKPPRAPRPSRWASPMAAASPISPLPTPVSGSSSMLTVRSGIPDTPDSCGSIRGFSDAFSSPSPTPPMPRGDLFHLGLTPIQSVRSTQSLESPAAAGEPLFAPALPITQRVSTVNLAREVADLDMVDVPDVPHPGELTPTPSRTASTQWLPSLSIGRHATQNPSTTAVFESNSLAQPRRTNFMSRLVGSAWGLAGIGFTSMHGSRRTQIGAPQPQAIALAALPTIPRSERSIEQAVFGPNVTTSRLSMTSTGSRLHIPASELPPANSTLRMTGSKSARAFDHEENEARVNFEDNHAKIEQRPKKKRRSDIDENTSDFAPSPTARVTRSMSARQAEVTTPTRVTRSTSKRLSEVAVTPTRVSYDSTPRRSKSLKRI